MKTYLKGDLCEDLQRLALIVQGKTIKVVQVVASATNSTITFEEDSIVEVWVRIPEENRQVLWEGDCLIHK